MLRLNRRILLFLPLAALVLEGCSGETGRMSAFPPDSPLVAEVLPSPNIDARRGEGPEILLLHYTGMATPEAAIERLCDPEARVSCHYVVLEDGKILQLVPERSRAWHAGLGSWEGEGDINSRSIGIEIVNRGHDFDYPDFPQGQIEAVIALCRDICARNGIVPEKVLAHSDVAPARKRDPGEKFPWDRLFAAGVGHWVKPVPIGDLGGWTEGDSGDRVEDLQSLLALYGYGVEISGHFDATTAACVRAFQLHFRPEKVDGLADASTVNTLRDLLAALPEPAEEG
jgi:N-acetylmuramoyl-L-alanine amidase